MIDGTRRYDRMAPALLVAWSVVFLVPAGSASAEEEGETQTGWRGSAEVSAVMTSGNSEAESFGAKAQFHRKWEKSGVRLEASGLRAESTTTRRFGVGTPGSFRLVEESTTELTAENYFLRSRYDRAITERFFWFVGAGWERNTFAGFDNRYSGTVGAGHQWIDTDDVRFSTTYGVTYTRQEEVVGGSDSFAGVRLGYQYERQITPTTTFGSALLADANLDETSDYRLDSENWIQVSMTDRLALKVGLQALYDGEPSRVAVTLFDEAGEPTGATGLATLEELDLLWTAALVVKF